MKDKELLKAVGDVDERFIDEASYQKEKTAANLANIRSWGWKRWSGAVAAVLVIALIANIVPGFFGGMGMKKEAASGSYMPSDMGYDSYRSESPDNFAGLSDTQNSKYANAGEVSAPGEASSGTNLIKNSVEALNKNNLKLIYIANISLQTTEFAKSEKALEEAVAAADGFFQSVEKDNGSYYSDGSYLNAYYVVRIPADKYQDFISGVGKICHVESISQNVKDVGEAYFEIESRLETLRIKMERLQELLKKASDMSDIIVLENQISDVQYQMDNYKSDLNRYDSLIGYSTVNINMRSVIRTEGGLEQDNSFGARLARSFQRAWNNFTDGCENFVLGFAENIFMIVIVVAVIVVFIRFRIFSRLWGKIRNKEKKQKA